MKRITLVLMSSALSLSLFAQNTTQSTVAELTGKKIEKDPNDTTKKTWKLGGLIGISLAQASLSNWAAGGDDYSLSLTSNLRAYAYYKKGKHSWDNTLGFNYGVINTTSLGTRKNDDRFDLLSKYGYELNPKLNLTGLFNFRTQFFKGYTYSSDGQTAVMSSDFLSPAYALLGLGLDYHPVKNLSIYVSPVTARWIIVQNDSLAAQAQYGVDSNKHVKFQFGAYATISYTTNITKTLSYTGRLDLFSDYLHNPQNIAINMTNLFAVKISKVISATWSLDLIYDDNIRQFGPNKTSPGLQVKSLIGAGLLVKI